MDPLEYLRAFRRRWAVLVASALVALVAGWLTRTVVGTTNSSSSSYEATAVLLQTSSVNIGVPGRPGTITSLETIAALATIGEVPVRVARELDFEGDPQTLAADVDADVDPETGLLEITAKNVEPEEAVRVANEFANQLLRYLVDRQESASNEQARALNKQMDQLRKEIAELDREIAALPEGPNVLTAQREGKAFQLQELELEYQQSVVPASSGLEIIQEASARPDRLAAFQVSPPSSGSRLLVATLIGLILGAGIVLLLERFDTRIRTKLAAEKNFGLPVLAEIPPIPRRLRTSVMAADGGSRASDAFRLLGAGLAGGASRNGHSENVEEQGNGQPSHTGHPRKILVTSAAPAEGKSTVVANLAASFGELGKKVLVVSCDFRRPDVHRLFGLANDPGLAEALHSSNGSSSLLRGYVQMTPVWNVFLLPSGSAPDRPGELLTSENMRRALEEGLRGADIVLIDTPPILTATDGMHLLGQVDAVVLVARAGKTTAEQAQRSAELLKRLGAPVVGVALTAATEGPVFAGHPRVPGSEPGQERRGIPGLERLSKLLYRLR